MDSSNSCRVRSFCPIDVDMLDGQSCLPKVAMLGVVASLLCFSCTFVYAQPTSDFIFENLDRADWTISNKNGSISFSAGHLPVMVLEALVKADQVDQGDPLAG